jgi:hypothetical protein
MKTRKASTRKPRARQGHRLLAEGVPHPPPIHPQLRHSQRLRFLQGSSGGQIVTFQNLLDCMLVATTATAGVDVFDTVRVKFVEMWAVGSATTPVTVSCAFAGQVGSSAGSGEVMSDTSISTAAAHIKAKPRAMSAAALFQGSNAMAAFNTYGPVGTLIDVCVEYRNADVASVVPAQNALVGATAGQFYYRGMDGLAVAATKYPPQGPSTPI